MTVFWSLAAVMMMVALLFVLPPLLRQRRTATVSRDELNTKVIREQFAELEADLAIGKLDRAQYDAARKDIERELLYDLDSGESEQPNKPERSGRWITLLLIPAIPLCAVLLYQIMGSAELIDRPQPAPTAQQSPASPPPGSIEEMTAKLAARLQQQPDDLKGWVMLARSYTIMKRYSEAENAYANALRLGGENVDLLTDYADSMVMADGGVFNDESGALLSRALELDPGNIKGLWLAGHWKNQSGAYTEALDYWQQAAAQLPADSKDAAVINEQIGQLQAKLGIAAAPGVAAAPAAVATTPATDTDQGASLQVHVSLATDIATAAAADDTVFIYARAAQGPRMPLAIVRKQVKDLPITVTLNDSMAMTPQMVLSNFDQVTVGARVSKTGGAMPVSGDLQGSVSPVDTQTGDTIQITIDSKIP
ncbi:MAG: c-type cytochrome biogenesis protein CcmI [Gammaproteobacteria bacterium]|nr:c-type cytochrome biogenesis protein CcmI [Gammaproteobacteria bacterium]